MNQNDLVSFEQVEQSFTDFQKLQEQLPEGAVVALAREVLQSLAKQTVDPESQSRDVLDLCNALIGTDNKAAAALVEGILKQGVDANQLYLEYLGPASQKLGQWWTANKVTFADVTVGTGRIYAIMRTIERRNPRPINLTSKTALFATIPGEDHILGLRMAADMARKDGWEIELALDESHDALIDRITSENHLIIGLSAAGKHALPNLARLVFAIRVNAPKAYIFVGGNIADVAEQSIKLMDVDGMATDYQSAMANLENFWAKLQPDLA